MVEGETRKGEGKVILLHPRGRLRVKTKHPGSSGVGVGGRGDIRRRGEGIRRREEGIRSFSLRWAARWWWWRQAMGGGRLVSDG